MGYTIWAKPLSLHFPSPEFGERGGQNHALKTQHQEELGQLDILLQSTRTLGEVGVVVVGGDPQTTLHDLYVGVQVTPRFGQNTFREERKRDGSSCLPLTTENTDWTVWTCPNMSQSWKTGVNKRMQLSSVWKLNCGNAHSLGNIFKIQTTKKVTKIIWRFH